MITKDKGLRNGVIQIGPNMSNSILDIANKIVKISEKNVKIELDLSKPEGDLDRSADFSKATEILNWKPKTSLEDGLSMTYNWINNSINNS